MINLLLLTKKEPKKYENRETTSRKGQKSNLYFGCTCKFKPPFEQLDE